MIRKTLTLIAAAGLAASPALAQSSASALSLAPAVDRAGPSGATSDLEGGSIFPIIVAAGIVIAGILLATGVIFDDNNEEPTSP